MKTIRKPIRLTHHCRMQLAFRGTSQDEILRTIRTTEWQPAELGRLECRKDFLFGRKWNSRRYETKQVRPIFVDEADEIVVITVYVYYF